MATITHNIAGHYLSAVVNNDYSGLDKEDISALNTWLALQGLSFNNPINWQAAGFCRCEVTGLKAECQAVTWKEGR